MQRALSLDGHCNGPLFAPAIKRPAARIPRGSTLMPGRLRRASERRATPAWADRRKMAALFHEARRQGMSVDHIVPLSHPLVCGLHCHANLRLVPMLDNLVKGNRWWPDMPGEQGALF